MPESILLSLLPALVILAFRTLCTVLPAPVPTYIKKPTPDPVPWAPEPWELPWSWVIGGALGVTAIVIACYWLI